MSSNVTKIVLLRQGRFRHGAVAVMARRYIRIVEEGEIGGRTGGLGGELSLRFARRATEFCRLTAVLQLFEGFDAFTRGETGVDGFDSAFHRVAHGVGKSHGARLNAEEDNFWNVFAQPLDQETDR